MKTVDVIIAVRVYRDEDGTLAAYGEGADGIDFDTAREWLDQTAHDCGHGPHVMYAKAVLRVEVPDSMEPDLGTISAEAAHD